MRRIETVCTGSGLSIYLDNLLYSNSNEGKNTKEPIKLARSPSETIIARVPGVEEKGLAVKRMGIAARMDVPLERNSGMNLFSMAECNFSVNGILAGALSSASIIKM